MRFRNSAASGPCDVDLAERRGVHQRRRPRAPRGTRAAPPRPCPRRRAGSSTAASTGRRPRRRRRGRRARRASGVVADRVVAASPRSRPASAAKDDRARTAAGTWSCRAAPTSAPSSAAARRRVDARGLALVGAGADRGVALDVLDRAQAGADGPARVGHGGVALEVDEVRRPTLRRRPARASSSTASPSAPSATGSRPVPRTAALGAPRRRRAALAQARAEAEAAAAAPATRGRRGVVRHEARRARRRSAAAPAPG